MRVQEGGRPADLTRRTQGTVGVTSSEWYRRRSSGHTLRYVAAPGPNVVRCVACVRDFPSDDWFAEAIDLAPCKGANVGAMLVLNEDGTLTPHKAASKPRAACTKCNRPLVPDVDAYYGRDPNEVGKCKPCRDKQRIGVR
jgi:hypothetical protein